MTGAALPDEVRVLLSTRSIIPIGTDKKPWREDGEHPLPWKRFQSQRPTAADITRWASQSPPAWAQVTGSISGIVTVDFDGAAGRALAKTWGVRPHRHTPNDGLHLDVKHPGWPVPTLNGKAAEELGRRWAGLDIRGDGGYAIVSGQISAGAYEWLRGPEPEALTAVPSEVWAFLAEQREHSLPPAEHSDNGTRIDAGRLINRAIEQTASTGRNVAGFWLACQLRDQGYSESQAETAMREYCDHAPPTNLKGQHEVYSWTEARASLRQAYLRPPRQPWTASTKNGATPRGDEHGTRTSESAKKAKEAKKALDWPEPPGPAAFAGLAGEIVAAVGPHTEADPTAVLLQTLVAFGNAIDHGPHCMVGATRHGVNEYGAVVGETSKARKGDSWTPVELLFRLAEPDWGSRVKSGLSTGEGIIHALRDPLEKDGRLVDEGEPDKRLLVIEAELARVLRAMERTGNTLSPVMRDAWDGRTLRILTRSAPETATGAHLSVIGHVTLEELRRNLTEMEIANGFANRFLWALARRSKLLPDPEPFDGQKVEELARRLRERIEQARRVGLLKRDDEAAALWCQVYAELSQAREGMAGALLARAEAHCLRLSALYALLDGCSVIAARHLLSALELWAYCERSVEFVFADRLGDAVADTVARLLREHGKLTRSQLSNLLGRHVSAGRLDSALAALDVSGRARTWREETGGRPVEWWEWIE